jgi:hypothetical protein
MFATKKIMLPLLLSMIKSCKLMLLTFEKSPTIASLTCHKSFSCNFSYFYIAVCLVIFDHKLLSLFFKEEVTVRFVYKVRLFEAKKGKIFITLFFKLCKCDLTAIIRSFHFDKCP